MSRADEPDPGKLHLSDPDEDLFASPQRRQTSHKHTPSSSSAKQQQQGPKQSKEHVEEARNLQLRAELEKVREVNRIIEQTTASLRKAKENMQTVHSTVNNASTLLGSWTSILSQTEYNQRLLLNPNWQGATQDMEDMENEDLRRQEAAERKAMEEQRRREEAQQKAEEEERKRAAAEAKSTRGVSRTRSVRGTKASTLREYTGVGGQGSRARGSSSTRGTSGIGRGSSTSRGRGRGLG